MEYLSKENGCKGKKCPCELWINCRQYIDQKNQLLRLQKKKYTFYDWYNLHFRVEPEMGEISNG